MANPFVHMELSVDDVGAAKAFYKKLFDWKVTDLGPKNGNYNMINFGSTTSGGGIQKRTMPGQPTSWVTYVQVASVKKTLAKAIGAGATTALPFTEMGGMGAIAVIVDPQGAMLGLYERGAPPKPAKKTSKKTSHTASKKAPKKAKKARTK